jgi:hypothetical protein
VPRGDPSLEDIHRLLEMADEASSEAASITGETIDAGDLPTVCELVMEVLDWSRTAYGEDSLGISPTILNRFLKMRGIVRKTDAIVVVDRTKNRLRSQDQISVKAVPARRSPRRKRGRPVEVATPFSFKAEQWVAVTSTSPNAPKIAALASILDSIIQQAIHSNAPEDQQALTKIEREQLIAILETALNVLRAPIVETGLMKKARAVLEKAAISAAEKGTQEGLVRSWLLECTT